MVCKERTKYFILALSSQYEPCIQSEFRNVCIEQLQAGHLRLSTLGLLPGIFGAILAGWALSLSVLCFEHLHQERKGQEVYISNRRTLQIWSSSLGPLPPWNHIL